MNSLHTKNSITINSSDQVINPDIISKIEKEVKIHDNEIRNLCYTLEDGICEGSLKIKNTGSSKLLLDILSKVFPEKQTSDDIIKTIKEDIGSILIGLQNIQYRNHTEKRISQKVDYRQFINQDPSLDKAGESGLLQNCSMLKQLSQKKFEGTEKILHQLDQLDIGEKNTLIILFINPKSSNFLEKNQKAIHLAQEYFFQSYNNEYLQYIRSMIQTEPETLEEMVKIGLATIGYFKKHKDAIQDSYDT